MTASTDAKRVVDELLERFRFPIQSSNHQREVNHTKQALQLRPVLSPPAATSFRREGPWLHPSFPELAWRGAIQRADVALAETADGAFELRDQGTGMTIQVSLVGASGDSTLETASGYVVYRHALGSAHHIVHRVSTGGTEDYVIFAVRPAEETIAYTVHFGPEVAGLRLVANVLEFVDAAGAPRLRMASPYLVDEGGRREVAKVSVHGCAYDDDPRGPWGRPSVPPGEASCRVNVSWPGSDLAYPAILDPPWTTTGSMAEGRGNHAASVLADGRVLVAGGMGQAPLTSAELYDPPSGTWAVTGGMTQGRRAHTASSLGDGNILVAGGEGPLELYSAELYDPTSGSWTATASMHVARFGHTASILGDGNVLVVGGGAMGGPGTYAELYTAATGNWSSTGDTQLQVQRYQHSASVLTDGRVLVAGGWEAAGSTAELYDPTTNAWSATGSMAQPRENHTTSVLADGRVLVAGGDPAELYDPADGTWTSTGSMQEGRSGHTATTLDDGSVLVTGAALGAEVGSTAEAYVTHLGTWSAAGNMAQARGGHTASLLSDSRVLVAGGATDGGLSSAELFELLSGGRQVGDPCNVGVECAPQPCIDGVCCNAACDGLCEACSTEKKGAGDDGTCGPIGEGLNPDDECPLEAEPCQGTAYCDGAGQCACISGGGAICLPDGHTLEGPAGTQDCAPYRCTPAGNCLTACTTAVDCVEGYRCSADGVCGLPDAAEPADEGCACSAPGGAGGRGLGLFGLLCAVWAARRIRERGRSRGIRIRFHDPCSPGQHLRDRHGPAGYAPSQPLGDGPLGA